ncbi:MAG: hypothetical protein ACKOFI_06605, partial [Phycisphaerales bacterium]
WGWGRRAQAGGRGAAAARGDDHDGKPRGGTRTCRGGDGLDHAGRVGRHERDRRLAIAVVHAGSDQGIERRPRHDAGEHRAAVVVRARVLLADGAAQREPRGPGRAAGLPVVVVSSRAARAALARLVAPHIPGSAVLSFDELVRGIDIDRIGEAELAAQPQEAAA